MTPAEIEAEAERLFAAWAAPQPHRLDFDMLGELARGPWLAVAEASLAARASLTDAQVEGFAQTAVDDICKGFERPRSVIARAIRAALNASGLVTPPAAEPEPALPPVTITCLCRPDVRHDGAVSGIRTNHRCTVHGLPQYRDHDGPRLLEAHERIANLPFPAVAEAARRLSRSYSAPRTCVEHGGCRREGDDIVWPDGERWPTRTEGT